MDDSRMGQVMATLDGNEAIASVAHRLSEVVTLFPITPSSPMGEFCDDWTAQGKTNIWGTVPDVVEMQSEGGAAGAIHGALQAGALSTTFTASQGLLLMIPNMYKIAGELTAFTMHVAARTLATHALSIFGDHSDVMACRQTGFALLASGSVQEAHDFACVATAAALKSRVPFLHFMDGFRTSHEVAKINMLSNDQLKAMMDEDLIAAHRARALTPDRPVLRGTAQNPDAFFQAREACNGFYDACPAIVAETFARFAEVTGRRYGLIEYFGDPAAEKVVILMGSGAETAHEAIDYMTAKGERVGLIKVRLYRPFPIADFVTALPASTKRIVVLDRTKEPGAVGEPLYLDVIAALTEDQVSAAPRFAKMPLVIGGRYGLSSKEFTPAMVKAALDEVGRESPRRRFTVGINDDVTHLSLAVDDSFDVESSEVIRAMFYGLGADGTVGANKNSIKIIADEGNKYGQGYFVYDSKKSGAITVSHLRFSPQPIRSAYLIRSTNFVACHQFVFVERYDMLSALQPGGIFLLNAPYPADQVWDQLPKEMQEQLIAKKVRFYAIDADKVAREAGMGRRINTIMQVCFFALANVLPKETAIGAIKYAIDKTYGRKSAEIVKRNYSAVDAALDNLHEIKVPAQVTTARTRPPLVSEAAPDFVKRVSSLLMAGIGDTLPVSAFPIDGTWPTATAKYEKRNIALEMPVWDPKICTQCNKCSLVCPHAAIRVKAYDPGLLKGAPETFKSTPYKAKDFGEAAYTVQVAPEDCTGCGICVEACPAKDKSNPRHKAIDMTAQPPLREPERVNFDFFLNIPEVDRTKVLATVKHTQFLEPLFEFSGACAGCGETPYIKLLTQLFGDRLLIANATGCTSIYGGNLPTTPYTTNRDGRGPAWSNSLFEDNAEFGFGMRLAVDSLTERAKFLVRGLSSQIGDELVTPLLSAVQTDEAGIQAQRERVAALKAKLGGLKGVEVRQLGDIADYLVRKSVWIIGGDGWAYDIGYGGLDHVLGMCRDVNVLVLDTEVYSNTGGQQSKATPIGAAAKFAMAGRAIPKKDLGMEAMAYENVYVARIAFGAKDAQTVRAFQEAESYTGASLIIAYSHCIAHGYDLVHGLKQQELATQSGHWPLYRFDPRRLSTGEPPLRLDSAAPKVPLGDFMRNETRFRIVERQNPERFKTLLKAAEQDARLRFDLYSYMAKFAEPVELESDESSS